MESWNPPFIFQQLTTLQPQAGHVMFPAGLPATLVVMLKLPLHLPVTEDQWYYHQKVLSKRQTAWGSDTESEGPGPAFRGEGHL